jgi:hypothetical protein
MPQDNFVAKREYLLDKLTNKTLTENEALELQKILNDERNRAVHFGEALVVLGTGILLSVIADYLSKNKPFWKKWFK